MTTPGRQVRLERGLVVEEDLDNVTTSMMMVSFRISIQTVEEEVSEGCREVNLWFKSM